MNELNETKIVLSWQKNSRPWIKAIEQNEIESRRLITNQAIIETILNKNPKSVLDIGCGEGWLTRELQNVGIPTLGIDIIPQFIAYADKYNLGRFKCMSYDSLSFNNIQEKFDLLVCNFSLLGHDTVATVFKNSNGLLKKGGYFVVQTLHPNNINAHNSGWQGGSWDGFSSDFCDPHPWYFRDTQDWKALFLNNGFPHLDIVEPLNPNRDQAASIIFVGRLG